MYFWSLHNAQFKCLCDVSWVGQWERREFTCRMQGTWLILCLAVESHGWLCWPFLYFSEQISLENIHLKGLHFWHLRQFEWLTTEFYSLAIFFRLWMPLIFSWEVAGPLTGLRGPRANAKSGTHKIGWGGIGDTPPRKFWNFTCSEVCSAGFWGFFSCMQCVHAVHTY